MEETRISNHDWQAYIAKTTKGEDRRCPSKVRNRELGCTRTSRDGEEVGEGNA